MTSGMESAEACCESREPGRRKQWAAGPPETVLLILDNASRISSDSTASTSQTFTASTHGCTLAAAFIAEMYKRLEADIRGFFFCLYRCIRGTRRTQAEEKMGARSSGGASEVVRESRASQSLQHLSDPQRRSVVLGDIKSIIAAERNTHA